MRVRVEPAAEGEESTFDVLEKFARGCENGTVIVEKAKRHTVISGRYLPRRMVSFSSDTHKKGAPTPRGDGGTFRYGLLAFPDVPGHVLD